MGPITMECIKMLLCYIYHICIRHKSATDAHQLFILSLNDLSQMQYLKCISTSSRLFTFLFRNSKDLVCKKIFAKEEGNKLSNGCRMSVTLYCLAPLHSRPAGLLQQPQMLCHGVVCFAFQVENISRIWHLSNKHHVM